MPHIERHYQRNVNGMLINRNVTNIFEIVDCGHTVGISLMAHNKHAMKLKSATCSTAG